ncbi:hypothetical protein F984_00268 [Acinetobacter nosocomialis NIPH 2119]|nr:hypothetical protein F984_00268 [Acinetobacter nosocomialis NIPH 2119]SSV24322.1 Uncharacterised protein [Acinetobacter nosocomialis]SSV40519.1 Uncharacterised protein [Acinetobacter nosocomialis]
MIIHLQHIIYTIIVLVIIIALIIQMIVHRLQTQGVAMGAEEAIKKALSYKRAFSYLR